MTITTGTASSANTHIFNTKGSIGMNRREIIIATNEHKVFDWIQGYLTALIGNSYVLIFAKNKSEFKESIRNPRIEFAFIETDFFGDKTIGMLKKLSKQNKNLSKIIFAVSDVPDHTAARYIYWGADSFLSLRDEPEQTREYIKRLLAGEQLLPTKIWRHIEEYMDITRKKPNLTHKEFEVVLCLAKEKLIKEISIDLNMSVSTVNNHISHIYEKFGIHNSVGVLKLAVSNGILPVEELMTHTVQNIASRISGVK
jgi:DNA-binding NarL/FixJ family response regulator